MIEQVGPPSENQADTIHFVTAFFALNTNLNTHFVQNRLSLSNQRFFAVDDVEAGSE